MGTVDPEKVRSVLARADEEVRSGRTWRAREILEGALRTYHESPVLLERYGRVLDELGDRVEAGKYLLLSGAEGPEVEEAIRVFLDRHGRGDRLDLLGQFPRRIRQTPLGRFPPRLRERLLAMGVEISRDPDQVTLADALERRGGWKERLGHWGCAALGVFLIVSCLVGIVTIVTWLAGL